MSDDRGKVRGLPCAACSGYPTDPAHIKSRGAGAGNAEWELIPLCRVCHVLQHKRGWLYMAENFPGVAEQLTAKGWEFDHVFKKWLNSQKR